MAPMDRWSQNLHSVTKTRKFGSKIVKFEAFKNHDFYTKKKVFLFICAQLFSSIVLSK